VRRVRNILRGACEAGQLAPPVIVDLLGFVCRQPVSGKLLNERQDLLACPFGYIWGIPAQGTQHLVDRVPSVKELPHVDAGRAETKTMTGIGVEEDGPVVKLLPEHDVRIGYGFVTVFHRTNTGPLRVMQHSYQQGITAGEGGRIGFVEQLFMSVRSVAKAAAIAH
jgi:hypothetical protein